ncbi:MAG TPA: HAMP domain-containing protein, partial [Planctomycetaceae bacterium]|nr:HAMP domain-containing protein [Planctomycetaceae bacterium]
MRRRSDNGLPPESSPSSIRFQLLVSVNLVLAVAVAVFLVMDYQAELAERIADKHISLQEEALTMAQAIRRLCGDGLQTVQKYIDDVCGRMRESHSPGHHIAVIIGDRVLQAVVHHRSSPEMVAAMRRAAVAPNHRARFGDRELVVGAVEIGDVTVYVSEYLIDLRQALHAEYWFRLLAIAGLGLLAAAVVDAVLLRVIVRPTAELAATIRRIGSGELGIQTRGFQSAEYAFLGRAINEMSRSLAEVERHRQREMARARRIQEHLLPTQTEVPGLALACLFQPAEIVAGDYYDIVPLPDGCWLLGVADVTGHGVPAAMVATMLKTFVTHAVEHHTDPGEILAFVNARFTAVALPEHFASMLLARWNPATAALDYASAGHEPPLLLSGDQVSELRATGLLLGAVAEARYSAQHVKVVTGDRLLLTTDGASETRNPEGKLFGRRRLGELFRA